jgi:hypothetical protein
VPRGTKQAGSQPSGIHGALIRVLTVPTVADDLQYEYTSAQAFRGTEAKVIAKWRTDGWEVDSRDQGLLRTELTFRRVKPTTLASRARMAFGRLQPKVQLSVMAGAGVLVLGVIGGGVVAGTQAGGSTPALAASATDAAADAEPSEKPSEAAVRAPAATTSAVPTTAPPAPTTVAPAPEAPKPQTSAPVAPKPQTAAPVAPKPPAPAPAPPVVAPPVANPPASTPFKNCSAAKAAGAAPVRIGDAGYGPHLDTDGDGVGCES